MWYVVSKSKEFFHPDFYYNEKNDTSLSLVNIKNGFRTAAKAKKRAKSMAKRSKNGREYDIVYKEEE